MLISLGIWRHVYKRFAIRYDPLYWGLVFPLAMYAVCTFRLAKIAGVWELSAIAHLFLYVAMAAWLLTFGGLLHFLWVSVRHREGVCV